MMKKISHPYPHTLTWHILILSRSLSRSLSGSLSQVHVDVVLVGQHGARGRRGPR
jgi:hypothetical protein